MVPVLVLYSHHGWRLIADGPCGCAHSLPINWFSGLGLVHCSLKGLLQRNKSGATVIKYLKSGKAKVYKFICSDSLVVTLQLQEGPWLTNTMYLQQL